MAKYTIQSAQANLGDILNDMDAGLITSIELIEQSGGATIAKLVKQSTFAAADIATARDLTLVPQIQLQCGPMTNTGTDGLYKITKVINDNAAVADGTVKATLQITQGAGGVLYTAKRGGVYGNSLQVTYAVAGLSTPLSVAVVVGSITVNLATDGAGAATSTAAEIAAAVNASAAASALVTAVANGTTSTVGAAAIAAPLAGGADQPTGVKKFQAFGIFRKRTHTKTHGTPPSVTSRAVLISAAHAAFLGL